MGTVAKAALQGKIEKKFLFLIFHLRPLSRAWYIISRFFAQHLPQFRSWRTQKTERKIVMKKTLAALGATLALAATAQAATISWCIDTWGHSPAIYDTGNATWYAVVNEDGNKNNMWAFANALLAGADPSALAGMNGYLGTTPARGDVYPPWHPDTPQSLDVPRLDPGQTYDISLFLVLPLNPDDSKWNEHDAVWRKSIMSDYYDHDVPVYMFSFFSVFITDGEEFSTVGWDKSPLDFADVVYTGYYQPGGGGVLYNDKTLAPIPEPATGLLVAAGGVMLLLRRRRRG